MTRGNQRELARQKNQKKQQGQGNKKDDGLTLEQRRQRDAERLREKQQAKQQAGSSSSDANKKG